METTETNLEIEAWAREATPAEIDKAWAEALTPANRVFEQAVRESTKAGKYRRYGGKTYTDQADRYDENAKTLFAKYREMRDAVEAPYRAVWDERGGWSRAYLVPDGHIHKSTACHTLYPTTLVSWVHDLSGHDEDEIVAYAGAMACTVCYPSAPVEALRAAETAKKREGECPGSRTYATNMKSWGQRYVKCHVCGDSTSVTSAGNLRAHKKRAEPTDMTDEQFKRFRENCAAGMTLRDAENAARMEDA